MAESQAFEEESPLSPGSLALILSNLFRREDGEPMDFYVRKIRFQDRLDKQDLKKKLEKLNEEIDVSILSFRLCSIYKLSSYCLCLQRCGGKLDKEPVSSHAIELSFSELFDEDENVDSDIFDAEYIYACVKQLEILELEPFRYDHLNISSIQIIIMINLIIFFYEQGLENHLMMVLSALQTSLEELIHGTR